MIAPELHQQIVDLYRQGHSPCSIEKVLRLPCNGESNHIKIKRVLLRHGVKLRSAAEAHGAGKQLRERQRKNRADTSKVKLIRGWR